MSRKKKLEAWQGKKARIIHTALRVALWPLTHDRNVRTFDGADVETRVRRMLPDIPPSLIRLQVEGEDNSRQVLGLTWKEWAANG